MKKQYRQGDVFLVEIDRLPKGVKKKDKILAYGEVTGHTHRFETQAATVYTDGDTQYVVVTQPTELIHEEHENRLIQEGKYEVRIQQEFDLMEGVRQVMD